MLNPTSNWPQKAQKAQKEKNPFVLLVPFVLSEKNLFVDEMTVKYQVPRQAALGFPETLYPESRKKLLLSK